MFVNLAPTGVTWEEKLNNPIRLSCGQDYGAFCQQWLMWESPAKCGQCHPWADDPGFNKKETKQAIERKPLSRFSLWLLPLFPLSSPTDVPQ